MSRCVYEWLLSLLSVLPVGGRGASAAAAFVNGVFTVHGDHCEDGMVAVLFVNGDLGCCLPGLLLLTHTGGDSVAVASMIVGCRFRCASVSASAKLTATPDAVVLMDGLVVWVRCTCGQLRWRRQHVW